MAVIPSKDTSKAILSKAATNSREATSNRDMVDKATSSKDTVSKDMVSREDMASSNSLSMFSNSDLVMVEADTVQPCKYLNLDDDDRG